MGKCIRVVRVVRYYDITEDMPFQEKWLLGVLNTCKMNLSDLASKIHVARQTVRLYANNTSALSFPVIVAICYVTGMKDDPEEVYERIRRERK